VRRILALIPSQVCVFRNCLGEKKLLALLRAKACPIAATIFLAVSFFISWHSTVYRRCTGIKVITPFCTFQTLTQIASCGLVPAGYMLQVVHAMAFYPMRKGKKANE